MNFRKNIFFSFRAIKSFMSKTKKKSGKKNCMSRIKKADTAQNIVSSGIKGYVMSTFWHCIKYMCLKRNWRQSWCSESKKQWKHICSANKKWSLLFLPSCPEEGGGSGIFRACICFQYTSAINCQGKGCCFDTVIFVSNRCYNSLLASLQKKGLFVNDFITKK